MRAGALMVFTGEVDGSLPDVWASRGGAGGVPRVAASGVRGQNHG